MNSRLLEKGTKLHKLVEEVNSLSLEDKALFVQWCTNLTIMTSVENRPKVVDELSKMQERAINDVSNWVDEIPLRLKQALVRYREEGIETGDALKAFLSNDLRGFLNYADPETFGCVKQIQWWCYRFMPSSAYGRSDMVAGWLSMGGIKGAKEDNPDAYKHWEVKKERELEELGRDSEL